MAGEQVPQELSANNIPAMLQRAMAVPGMRLTLSVVPSGYHHPAPFLATASWSTGGPGPVTGLPFPSAHRNDPIEALAYVIRHAFQHGGAVEGRVAAPEGAGVPSDVEDLLSDGPAPMTAADEVEDLLAL